MSDVDEALLSELLKSLAPDPPMHFDAESIINSRHQAEKTKDAITHRSVPLRPALSVAGVLALVAALAYFVVSTSIPRHHSPAGRVGIISTSPPSVSNHRTSSGASYVQPCMPAALSGHVDSSGEAMGSEYVEVRLTNDAATSCSLQGYPTLEAIGVSAAGPRQALDQKLATIQTRGGTYRAPDPGTHIILLHPKQSAGFTISTVTSYQGGAHLFIIRQIKVLLPKDVGRSIEVDMPAPDGLIATAPTGNRLPLTVSAFQ